MNQTHQFLSILRWPSQLRDEEKEQLSDTYRTSFDSAGAPPPQIAQKWKARGDAVKIKIRNCASRYNNYARGAVQPALDRLEWYEAQSLHEQERACFLEVSNRNAMFRDNCLLRGLPTATTLNRKAFIDAVRYMNVQKKVLESKLCLLKRQRVI